MLSFLVSLTLLPTALPWNLWFRSRLYSFRGESLSLPATVLSYALPGGLAWLTLGCLGTFVGFASLTSQYLGFPVIAPLGTAVHLNSLHCFVATQSKLAFCSCQHLFENF